MWICKIKISTENTAIGGLCGEVGVSVSGYPLHTVKRGDEIYVNFMLFVFGEEENKKEFFNRLQSNPRVSNLEKNDHCIIGEIREHLRYGSMYNYKVFHAEPIKASNTGYEVWTVASWDKEELMRFVDAVEKEGAILLKIRRESVSNLSVLTLHPELTGSQRRAIELAIENKYYDIPRGIQLEELAKLMGISYSTYQSHLRKAEKKLLPFFFERN